MKEERKVMVEPESLKGRAILQRILQGFLDADPNDKKATGARLELLL